jgi:hypothetical protein
MGSDSLLLSSIVDIIVILGKFEFIERSCQMFRVNPNMNPVNDVISLLLRQPLVSCSPSIQGQNSWVLPSLRRASGQQASRTLMSEQQDIIGCLGSNRTFLNFKRSPLYACWIQIYVVGDEEHQDAIATMKQINERVQIYFNCRPAVRVNS